MVTAANVADCETPNRASVPSVAAPTAVGTVPPAAAWKPFTAATLSTASSAMVSTTARPWRLSPVIRPKTRGRLKGMTRISRISSQLLKDVGFSKGWELLAL